ncbi:MAG: NAD(P)/FAD-dependent oxidoreductase [Lachnospiraceae bacterium]|nr:NAD(P)/FAD-dependent oxidoreductase [Lachnospiraceae bacterium]
MNYDVIILGGGPAGAAAANKLSAAGISTVLIEKNKHPREKTCAGILTQKTISLLEENFGILEMEQIISSDQVTIMYKRNNIEQFTVQFPFVFVERHIFDYKLLNICQKNGTCIMEGVVATKIIPNENKIILSNNQTLTYKCLIAADGVFSQTRKQLGLPNLPTALCIQDTFERCTCPISLQHLQELQLSFGEVELGYSWIVPYPEHIIIGTGTFIDSVGYGSLLEKHTKLCNHIGLTNIAKRRGAFVPIGGFEDQKNHPYNNIVLVGDAAGLANPLTGEGIYHALLSGVYAATAYLLNSHNLRETYLSFLQLTLEQLAEQKSLLSKFYNPLLLENILFQLRDCPEYLSAICDDVVSIETRDYSSLIMELQQLLR